MHMCIYMLVFKSLFYLFLFLFLPIKATSIYVHVHVCFEVVKPVLTVIGMTSHGWPFCVAFSHFIVSDTYIGPGSVAGMDRRT